MNSLQRFVIFEFINTNSHSKFHFWIQYHEFRILSSYLFSETNSYYEFISMNLCIISWFHVHIQNLYIWIHMLNFVWSFHKWSHIDYEFIWSFHIWIYMLGPATSRWAWVPHRLQVRLTPSWTEMSYFPRRHHKLELELEYWAKQPTWPPGQCCCPWHLFTLLSRAVIIASLIGSAKFSGPSTWSSESGYS